MQNRRSPVVVVTIVAMVAAWSALSCGSASTPTPRPSYTIIELYAGGVPATDSTNARAVFQAYLAGSGEAAGNAPFHWTEVEYRRSFGREDYNSSTYWGIVARGLPNGGPTEETTQFRVRQDGVVVQMIGNI
jgi:hypothetical protein